MEGVTVRPLVTFVTVSVLLQSTGFALHGVDTRDKLGITGGELVSIDAVPYVAFLYDTLDYLFCGGSIVHEKFILTAARCFSTIDDPSEIQVSIGTGDWINNHDPIKVEARYCHKDFLAQYPFSNDICLLKLKRPVSLWPKATLVKLPGEDFKLKAGAQVSVSGWVDTAALRHEQLRQLTIPVMRETQCRKHYTNTTDTVFCAGSGGHSECSGDSGNPVVYNGVQVGVSSFDPNDPALPNRFSSAYGCVYTNVSSYLGWINTTISKNL